jgi:Protein of unknown function (DUF3097)
LRSKEYGPDVLAQASRRPPPPPTVAAELDVVVECADSGFCGAVVGVEKDAVTLEDRHGKRRVFALTPGAFLLDGERVTMVRPARPTPAPVAATRTASGSVPVAGLVARVARASRIYVEGKHDAELVEKVWGHDLRVEGVVVEQLDGVDFLPAAVAAFRPGPGRRLGVLVDHLVPGSKEARVAAQVRSPHVLVVGHPYVDVWQAVRPQLLGLESWPDVPRSVPWKEGVCAAAGWPHATPADLAAAWRRILGAVRSYADLDPALLGRVEELIDFVTGLPPIR